MTYRVEIFAVDGVAIAVLPETGSLREIVEGGRDVLLENATWHPLDGTAARSVRELRVAPDDIHIAVSDEEDVGPVHAQWHDVAVDVGPYRVTGQMPTMPGFDPGRALARPTGEFVLLRDVEIALLRGDDPDSVPHRSALINRYVVDRVEADMMLGFFFPGAEMVVTRGSDSNPAGTDAAAAAAAPSAAAPAPSGTAAVTAEVGGPATA